jgi:Flp pilus assembly protein TadG
MAMTHRDFKAVISAKRSYRQKGSELVEFGLTIVPLFGFIFLIVDLAWMIFAQVTLQNAVRAGVRYAITGQTITGLGQDASIKAVVQDNAVGFLAGSSGLSKIVISYYDPVSLTATNSNAGGNIVKVSLSGFTVSPFGPILRSATPITINALSADRMEANGPNGTPAR